MAAPPPSPGGGIPGEEEEAKSSSQGLASLLISVAFTLLVAPLPSSSDRNSLLLQLHVASAALMLCTGVLLMALSVLTKETTDWLKKAMNTEGIAWLRDWVTVVAFVSLLMAFLLRCCIQVPRPCLIPIGGFFLGMLFIATITPLLLAWSEHKKASSTLGVDRDRNRVSGPCSGSMTESA